MSMCKLKRSQNVISNRTSQMAKVTIFFYFIEEGNRKLKLTGPQICHSAQIKMNINWFSLTLLSLLRFRFSSVVR